MSQVNVYRRKPKLKLVTWFESNQNMNTILNCQIIATYLRNLRPIAPISPCFKQPPDSATGRRRHDDHRYGQKFRVKRKDQSGSMIARATKFHPIKMHPQKFVDPERGHKHSFKIGAPEPTLFRVILTRKGWDICDSDKWSEFWPGIFKSVPSNQLPI